MLIYLLKSGVCLAVFYGFYKLLLEKESIHTFKRYYLLTSLILSLCIPLITFTQYIEVSTQVVPEFTQQYTNEAHEIIIPKKTNYLPFVLWGIYGLGVLLFGLHFIKNLYQLAFKIKHNTKIKEHKSTKVLLNDLIAPHTFLSFIFLNKNKFEKQQIPKEVLLHEETHAIQKHSIDVLFIELMQILFWFNPLIYLIKHSIKLNHEFLADQAVLNKGVTPSTYQQILLAFSSNASEPQLANAINYSSIKKRITIMKTKTSKKAFWLRSFIMLPMLAILIYSFSDKKVIEKRYVLQKNIDKENEIKIFINKDRNVIIENQEIQFNSISDELIKLKDNSIKKNLSTPTVYIQIEGNLTNDYLDEIKNEVSKSGLKISRVQATTIFLDENEFDKKTESHIKGIQFTGDSIIIKTKKGESMKGFSGPLLANEIITPKKEDTSDYDLMTIKIPKSINYAINSNDLELISQYADSLVRKNVTLSNLSTKAAPPQQYQQKATSEEIKEYNEMIKKFNAIPEKKRIIRQKNVDRLKYIYSIMTQEQRAKSEAFPKLVPSPPPAPKVKKGETSDIPPPPPPIQQ